MYSTVFELIYFQPIDLRFDIIIKSKAWKHLVLPNKYGVIVILTGCVLPRNAYSLTKIC